MQALLAALYSSMRYNTPLFFTYKKTEPESQQMWKADTGPNSAMEADTDF